MDIWETFAEHANRPYVDFLRRVGLDFEVARAEGAVVEDQCGRRYIDCIAGYGNLNLGHNHPRVGDAIRRTLDARRPLGWPFVSETHAALLQRLVGLAPGHLDCCFIVNSGAEAVDSALKLVRLATGKQGVIACHGAWHGFTMGAMSVSEPAMRRGFGELLPGVRQVPYGDAAAVASAISPDVGAVIVEPIQAERGAVVPPAGYLRELAKLCSASGVVLIVDEIKTGIGKTGRMLACEHEQNEADVLLLGKSLGGGLVPIGAVVAKRSLWAKFGLSFPMSSSSGAGNAFACAAALATLDVMKAERLCEGAERNGQRLQAALQEMVSEHPQVAREVSGRGLLLGLHASSPRAALDIVKHCIRSGILLMTAFLDRSCILIEPPLCIRDEEIRQVSRTLREALAIVSRRCSAEQTRRVEGLPE